ncbi:HAD-IA family hydrolase [Lusitaniella coriacea LEGE 07157]|uniref:HAD-IA family hydrolase n=1 Tax=Lusitaniella coriacea LEGE 07157 TaxID=945747 RepID=A0A8J7DSN7_9CYAN|nr:HAD-IA family hydrolase [Lusitaniella coriacea]MBE9114457.1 HAD-IA family hydrolase [Lusitaniella coriacea LEGE 07157]
MHKPKVIFLDAVGTLFGVRGSVGEVYGAIARDFGVDLPCDRLNQAFSQSFKESKPLSFPGMELIEIPEKEFEWWQAITTATFEKIGARDRFSDFGAFFNKLYGHFATPAPWQVYQDILPVLDTWRKEKIELGIISNFDSRLHAVLESLDLGKYFQSITISSCTGVAKPNTEIFAIALAKHDCPPEQAWHIGDSIEEDYRGAQAAGLKAIWLKRSDRLEG